MVSLYDHQLQAVNKLRTGSVLLGKVGSGKSRTAIGYFFKENGGQFEPNYKPMDDPVKDLYIITTARKRDTHEWDEELAIYLLATDPKINQYKNKVVVDSWNNIHKYVGVSGAFFIFDEQRVVGKGSWAKNFIKIAKANDWILLSATPGDTWSDYAPLFIANGYFKNFTDFKRKHVVMNPYTKYPKIDHYINCGILIKYRRDILVPLERSREITKTSKVLKADYNKELYLWVVENRKNPFDDNKPCRDISTVCSVLRKIVNADSSRLNILLSVYEEHPKLIVFYNFDYELELMKNRLTDEGIIFAEWNGHKHEMIPETDSWVYLVQYMAGSEGWNCTKTNAILFYSQTYSYKQWQQAQGRVDRMNTPFTELYYYSIRSAASIDNSIFNSLSNKENFNEKIFIEKGVSMIYGKKEVW